MNQKKANIQADLIAKLWADADDMANKVADANARGRYLAWRIDTETPEPAKVLIIKVQNAMDSIWKQYSVARAAIVAGAEPDPITAPVDVPTFWDVAAAANTPQGAEHALLTGILPRPRMCMGARARRNPRRTPRNA